MEMRYYKEYSSALQRDMECKVYGHAGRPVLFIPCQNGRFFDFENYRMTDTWAPWIESGQVTVFAIDTLDIETWSAGGDAYHRVRRHEQWMRYIVDEMVPFIESVAGRRDIIAFGCSLGATHAVNLYFRFPDQFTGLLALSGIYSADFGFGGYMDEVVYRNSPVHYLHDMPLGHPYIKKYNRNQGIICVGQGDWEVPETTRMLDTVFRSKGIDVWVDYWGHDVAHDWPWWYKQVEYFVPKLLEA
ncbi:MAG: esterase family protein [Oscillospiraceae bacterium]|nr:esterase family protein [Oscillospiraceae bacterium]